MAGARRAVDIMPLAAICPIVDLRRSLRGISF
jgi:hypothetical protein